jgi:hypothetical protein
MYLSSLNGKFDSRNKIRRCGALMNQLLFSALVHRYILFNLIIVYMCVNMSTLALQHHKLTADQLYLLVSTLSISSCLACVS